MKKAIVDQISSKLRKKFDYEWIDLMPKRRGSWDVASNKEDFDFEVVDRPEALGQLHSRIKLDKEFSKCRSGINTILKKILRFQKEISFLIDTDYELYTDPPHFSRLRVSVFYRKERTKKLLRNKKFKVEDLFEGLK